MKLKVLCLLEYATLNGGEHSLLAALDAARSAGSGIEPVAVAPSVGSLANALANRHIRHVPLEFYDAGGTRHSLAVLRDRLHVILDGERPDLLHANSLSMSRLAGPVAAARGLPSSGHLRDIIRLSPQAVSDINQNTRLLAVSRATRDWHAAQGLDPAKIQVVYNGVELDRFAPRPAEGWLQRELRIPATSLLVGAIGQVGIRKGLEVFLAAAEQVASEFPEVHYLIIGQRYSEKEEAVRFEAELHRTAAQPPLLGRCHFLGYRADIPELLNQLTLLVHAARQEPLGRVLLEAAAAGVPVVATDVGGSREIFPAEDPPSAVLVPPGEVKPLVVGIRRLLSAPALRQHLGRAARARAEQRFDIRRQSAELASVWAEVASQPAAVNCGKLLQKKGL